MKTYQILLFLFLLSTNLLSQPCTPIPVNDSPCLTNANPPYDLGFEGMHEGTTCCAIGYNDDPNEDKANVECNGGLDDDAVWYRASISHDYEGVLLSVYDEYGTTIGYEHSVEVYGGGADAICDGTAELIRAYCIGEYVSEEHIGCLDAYDYLFIKIASTESDCGTFSIFISQDLVWGGADKCKLITKGVTAYPQTDSELTPYCISGFLNEDFCPDSELSSCDVFETNGTIWFKVVVDKDGNQLYSNVTTEGDWTPAWAVFKGDCDNLEVLESSEGFTCSLDSDPMSSPMWYGVSEGIYYIAVSSLEGDLDDRNFELCVATMKKAVSCLGDEDSCENDETTVFEIINRENFDLEPTGPPFNGPFCPGEKLTIQVEFTYETSQTGDERLLAMIPEFGSGWDIDYYDLYANPPIASGSTEAEWYDEDSQCYPYATENFDNLCVYTDENSKLHICNTLCEDCPCNYGLQKGDQIPSGYFWVQDGEGSECDPNDCSPSTKRGIEGVNGEVTVYWTIEIKVKDFKNKECPDSDDLSIGFMTFSDGGAGCWSDSKAECLLDIPQFSPDWRINCENINSVFISSDTSEICSGDTLDILVKSKIDTTDELIITFDDNPYVLGEKNHIFNGLGLINDTLVLKDSILCDSQIVYYFAEIKQDFMNCSSIKDTIRIIVYPKPSIDIITTNETAFGKNNGTATAVIPCADSTYNYLWSTGDTTNAISNLAPGSYSLIVTNDNGCIIKDTAIVNAYICKELEVFYTQNNLSCYDNCTGSVIIDSLKNGLEPYKYLWSTGDSTTAIYNLCTGIYTVTITDFANCNTIDTFTINSPSQLLINITSTDETKLNGNDGTAVVNPSGGTSPYIIIWSTGESDQMIDNLIPGKYYVTITDTNGCTVEGSTFINHFNCGNLSIVSVSNDVSCYGECNGSINISEVVNSTGVLTYNWSNGSNGNSINGLCAGKYSVSVTDESGCTEIDTFIIRQPDELIISIDSVKNIIGSDNGSIFVSVNGNGSYTYNWTGPNGFTGNTEDLTNLDAPGCYSLSVTDNATSCSRDTTVCIEKTNGFGELSHAISIDLYPNPTSGSFYLNIKGYNGNKAEADIIDVSGQKIVSTDIKIKDKAKSIDVSRLIKGIYFVKIKLDNKIVVKKLIVGI